MQILIVEDEEKIASFLRRGFIEESYAADIAGDGEDALYKFETNDYDLILLDLMIPKISGIEVCRKIRQTNKDIPILILTAKDSVDDKIAGLDAGADDYLTKPFALSELLARIRALLRRGNKSDPAILAIDNLTLDPSTKTAKRANRTIELTSREYALLEYFLRNQNRVISKNQILEHVWDYSYDGFSNVVETYVKYVRQKIQVGPRAKELIHTKRGLGYIMKVD